MVVDKEVQLVTSSRLSLHHPFTARLRQCEIRRFLLEKMVELTERLIW